jgi:hypothetical protein
MAFLAQSIFVSSTFRNILQTTNFRACSTQGINIPGLQVGEAQVNRPIGRTRLRRDNYVKAGCKLCNIVGVIDRNLLESG